MKKKLIGLSILLLVLLLGLFTTSYAFEYVISIEDCQTIANTYYGSKLPNDAKNLIWGFVSTCYTSYNVDTIIINIQNDDYFSLKGFNSNEVTAMYNTENKDTWNVSLSGSYYQKTATFHPAGRWTSAYWDSGSITTNTSGTCTFGSGGQYRTTYLLVSNDLGSLYTGPYQNLNILTLNQPQFFEFTYNNNLVIKELEDDISSLGLYVALFSGDTQYKNLGFVEQADLISSVIKEEYYWDKYEHSFIPYKAEVIDFTNSENIYSINIVPNDLANTYIQYVIYPEDETLFDIQYASYMIINNMTSVSGDSINIDSTFNDDNYYNNYIGTITSQKENEQAQDRTDEILNTITDDSQVDNILNTIPTSSGDVARDFGYSVIENPFTTFLYNIVERTFITLTEHETVVLNFDYKNMHFSVSSDDYIVPNSALKSLIRTCLVTIWIVGTYKYYHYILSMLQTAKVETAIQKFGTDEFYDTDIM